MPKQRRVTVSITEEEYQLCKHYKKRYGSLFNMSKIFREAIRDTIGKVRDEVADFEEWKKTKYDKPIITRE